MCVSSIDTMSNIQSCGGCWSNGSGEDCTQLLMGDELDGSIVRCDGGVCQGESILYREAIVADD